MKPVTGKGNNTGFSLQWEKNLHPTIHMDATLTPTETIYHREYYIDEIHFTLIWCIQGIFQNVTLWNR